jgi:hypothetical protein
VSEKELMVKVSRTPLAQTVVNKENSKKDMVLLQEYSTIAKNQYSI